MTATRHSTLRLALEYLDDVRIFFNSKCTHLEAWQIVSYSLSLCFLLAWVRRQTRSDAPLHVQLKLWVYKAIRSLPWVRKRIEADLAKALVEIEEEVHQFDQSREFYKFLPERGLDKDILLNEAKVYASMGQRKHMQYYDPVSRNDDLPLFSKINELFSHTDPHRSDAFPGVRKMEAEILKMACGMFHGGAEACGVVATGGTEALLLACLAYRNRARTQGNYHPEIIAPTSAHPSVEKAAKLFDMTVRRIAVLPDDTANVGAMKRAIGPNTCMIIASAPNHITGSMDPIEKLAKLAQRYHIPLHVDCSLGGFILPFMEYADYPAPSFDFRLPGVTSISTDLHRHGQTPSTLSVVMYRQPTHLRHQFFVTSEWPGGAYATPTLGGSRNGAAVATAWATMLRMGREGYVNCCQRIVEGTRLLGDKLAELEGVRLQGSADLCVVSFATDDVNIYNVIDQLIEKGWHVDPLRSPQAARVPITLSMCENGIIEEFVSDVESAIRSNGKPSNTGAFYSMLNKVNDKSIIDEIALLRLQAHYSIPPAQERRNLARAVEGRKLSIMTGSETAKNLEELRRLHK